MSATRRCRCTSSPGPSTSRRSPRSSTVMRASPGRSSRPRTEASRARATASTVIMSTASTTTTPSTRSATSTRTRTVTSAWSKSSSFCSCVRHAVFDRADVSDHTLPEAYNAHELAEHSTLATTLPSYKHAKTHARVHLDAHLIPRPELVVNFYAKSHVEVKAKVPHLRPRKADGSERLHPPGLGAAPAAARTARPRASLPGRVQLAHERHPARRARP